jgi:hypothetical protein
MSVIKPLIAATLVSPDVVRLAAKAMLEPLLFAAVAVFCNRADSTIPELDVITSRSAISYLRQIETVWAPRARRFGATNDTRINLTSSRRAPRN